MLCRRLRWAHVLYLLKFWMSWNTTDDIFFHRLLLYNQLTVPYYALLWLIVDALLGIKEPN